MNNRPFTQEDLPSVKIRPGVEDAPADQPIVAIAGRDLVGMPHTIALTHEEAKEMSKRLWAICAAFDVARSGGPASV
jgi:hypothetical protein